MRHLLLMLDEHEGKIVLNRLLLLLLHGYNAWRWSRIFSLLLLRCRWLDGCCPYARIQLELVARVGLIVADVDRVKFGDKVIDVEVRVELLLGATAIDQIILHERFVLIYKGEGNFLMIVT